MRGWVFHLQLLQVLASTAILRSKSRGTHYLLFLSQIGDTPNLEGQVPIFISPRNRVARLYSQALGSLFIASYDLQDYGGGVWPHLYTGISLLTSSDLNILLYSVSVSKELSVDHSYPRKRVP
jgi:hypothetical protein